jgi:hypothetical protein
VALTEAASAECKWVITLALAADVKPYQIDARLEKHG